MFPPIPPPSVNNVRQAGGLAPEIVGLQYPPPHPTAVLPPSVVQNVGSGHSSSNPHINPSVVVIVVILSVVFILSGFLHLLARCLGRRLPSRRTPQHSPLVSALHGQLQHLFHLHDAGVEQAFIDTLPVFAYGSIRGLKDSADCAVCLTEFADDDRLRLLPKCKHAFHLECIDTWLLSNSTCPLCRRSLLPDPGTAGALASLSLEEGLAGSSEMHSNRLCPERLVLEAGHLNSSLHGSIHGSYQNSFRICEVEEVGDSESECEIQEELETPSPMVPTIRIRDADGVQRVLKVELGKVTGKVKMDARKKETGRRRGGRSYSMGSYEYIVDPSNLELMIAPTPFPGRPQNWAPSKPTHRSALSDSIPELVSAGGTPANDDLFWASRGLYHPQTLSRVRELLTPSPGPNAFSPYLYSPGVAYGDADRWIDIDIEKGGSQIDEDEDEHSGDDEDEDEMRSARSSTTSSPAASPAPQQVLEKENDIKQRSSSLSRLPEGKANVSCYRRSLSETAGMEQAAANSKQDHSIWDVLPAVHGSVHSSTESVKQGSFSRRFSLNWFMGRDKRMVFSAASPSPSDAPHLDNRTPI